MSAIRVFVNGVALEVAAGSSAFDAVALADRHDAEGVKAGRRIITDSRGIGVAPASPVFGGAIFRTVRAPQPPESPHAP